MTAMKMEWVAAIAVAALGVTLGTAMPARAASAGCDGTTTAPNTYRAGDPVPAKRVAVMDLEVRGQYASEVRDALPELIEDRLLRAGWTVVVRGRRMAHVQEERDLPGVRPGTEPPDNELLGATALLELTARIQVNDTRGLAGAWIFGGGDVVKATVDLNGQIVDPATGVLKATVSVNGSQTGLRSLVLGEVRRWHRRPEVVGFDLAGIRQSLVGKAADKAADRLVDRLDAVSWDIPRGPRDNRRPEPPVVERDDAGRTVLLRLPDGAVAHAGDHYGIYREGVRIAEVEILRMVGDEAEARILHQDSPLRPTDRARPMPLVIPSD
jgi:hypothetical protein